MLHPVRTGPLIGFQTAREDQTRPLMIVAGDSGSQTAPRVALHVQGIPVLPLLGLFVEASAVVRDAEMADGFAGRELFELGVTGEVACDDQRVDIGHFFPPEKPSGKRLTASR